ncbi:MAG: fcf [Verrucomicrobia bacterium]|nr:fcf [Verrucomicrobiota bacterium]
MDDPPLDKRILLTGGRSRLAAVIHPALLAAGAEVTSLSRSEGGPHLGLENLFVNNLIEQTDTLLHLAWSTVPLSSERHVGLEWTQDIPLLIKVLKAACASPNREKLHFVFFSSGGTVYGNAQPDHPSCETDPCSPIGWYGHAKLAAERLIQEYGQRHGLAYTILRISNPYGFPVPTHKPQGIIPFLLQSAMNGTPFSVWGDGTARKDFLHHTDFTAALERIIRVRPPGIFNVCAGESHSVNEVIAHVEETLGRRIPVQRGAAHSWDVHDSLLDNSKLIAATGWRPVVRLPEGIRRAASDLDHA